jgi:foldase protein PrsA
MKKEKKNKQINEKSKNIKFSTAAGALGVFIILWIITGAVFIYQFSWENKFVKFTENIIPYPAATVNFYHFITVKELDDNLKSVRLFYENQDFSKIGMRVDFSTDEGKKRLMIRKKELIDKMIEDRAIEILARKRGIMISEKTVDQNVARKLEEYGSKDEVEANLFKLYGWTLADFKEKVVRPSMYKEELQKLILEQNKDNFSQAAEKKINKAEEELAVTGDFAQVAQEFSDGLSAEQGGEMGWFSREQLADEVSGPAFSLKKGERSSVIESSLGYHIIELEDKKNEDGVDLIKLKQIFTRKKMFVDWLEEQMEEMKINVVLKDFYWDKNGVLVNFSSDEMRKFEKNLKENYQGDASIIF